VKRPTVLPRASEAECEDAIIEAAHWLGFRVHAERPAQSARGYRTPVKGDHGFPDLVIAGHGHVLVVELKRAPNKVEPAQHAWLCELARAGVSTEVVWVPEGQQSFIALLERIAAANR
jgi:hypothetical protein